MIDRQIDRICESIWKQLIPTPMASPFITSQLLVACAIIFDAASFQFKERKKILFCFLVSSALLSCHFWVLGEPIGAVLYLLTFARFLTGYATTSRWWLWVFLAATVGASIVTYRSPASLLALCGGLCSTYGAFQRRDLRLRWYMLLGTALWLVYNVLIGSPVAIVRRSIFIVSNLVGLKRHYGKGPQTTVST